MNSHEDTRSLKSSASSGTKRKRDAGPKFYAVRVGNQPGVYHSWQDCLDQVKGFKGAVYKSFPSLTDAGAIINPDASSSKSSRASSPSKFYAVQSGRIPGVYTDWPSAQAQIIGWTKPKHKSFATKAEAEAFVHATSVDGDAVKGPLATTAHSDINGTTTKRGATSKAEKANPAKRQKKPVLRTEIVEPDENGIWPPGYGPLPLDTEDDFDERLILNPVTGKIEYKTEEQMNATKSVPVHDSMLKIWTDGSSLGNGQLGSSAGIGVYFGPGDARNVSAPLPPNIRQTNQRAELTALQRALELTPIDRPVTIFTDSSYAIDCAITWPKNWIKNNWTTSTKKPVEHRDIIEEIVKMLNERERVGVSTELKWLKGHANDQGNIAADALAVNGAKMGREQSLKAARDAVD